MSLKWNKTASTLHPPLSVYREIDILIIVKTPNRIKCFTNTPVRIKRPKSVAEGPLASVLRNELNITGHVDGRKIRNKTDKSTEKNEQRWDRMKLWRNSKPLEYSLLNFKTNTDPTPPTSFLWSMDEVKRGQPLEHAVVHDMEAGDESCDQEACTFSITWFTLFHQVSVLPLWNFHSFQSSQ